MLRRRYALLNSTAQTPPDPGTPPVVPLSHTHLGQVGGATVPNTLAITTTDADALVIVCASQRRNSTATNAFTCVDNTGDGIAWTLITDAPFFATNGTRQAFFKKRFAAATTTTITVNAASVTSIGIEVEQFLGASDDTTNFSPGATSTGGDPSCTLPTAPDIGSIVLGLAGGTGTATLNSSPAGMTLINFQSYSGSWLTTCKRQSVSTTGAWSTQGADSSAMLLEIKQGTATPPPTGGAIPTFVAAGPIVGGGATAITAISPTYPAITILDKDIAVLALHGDNHTTMAVPGGWTPMGAQVDTAGTVSARLWWQRCAGGESGAVACTRGTGAVGEWFGGAIAIYRGCVTTGDPFEGYSTTFATSATMTGPAITTTGPNRLGVHMYCIGDDTVSTPAAGWTEDFDAIEQSGNDGCQCFEHMDMATATTAAAVTRTIAVSNPWVGIGYALIPT